MDLGDKIYNLRKKSGYSQKMLAEKVNVSRQTVYKWETGFARPSHDKLVTLCKIFNELGHTFGLGHITDSRMSGYTVMFSPHPQGNDGKLTDYTEFDRYNIDWYYGK